MTVSRTQTIDSWLTTHADHQPDRPALNFDTKVYTYRQLAERVDQVAAGLQREFELQRGDRVAFYGYNSDTEVVLIFAAAKLGLILVPLNWRLSPVEINFILRDCGPKILFHGREFDQLLPEVIGDLDVKLVSTFDKLQRMIPVASDLAVESDADLSDPLLIVYTSGTTGQPKGAVITQEAVYWNATMSIHAHDYTAEDHVLNILPLFHIGGINIQMMPCFFIGGTVTLHATFDPDKTLDDLANRQITTTVCVPTVMRVLIAHPNWKRLSFPSLRLINTGSTDVPIDILETVNSRGIPMVQVYGTTETGPIATYQRAAEARETLGSIGRCGAHTQVRIVNSNGKDCGISEPGEIWIKGPNNFSFYWNNKEATEETLVDGWFKTGDIAYKDENNLYWFVDRLKHVIISGGENIYPAELERLLWNMPGIVEAAVVGRQDNKWGEVPVVVVVVDKIGPTRDEIFGVFENQLARFKQPRDVLFLDTLPKNALGKVMVSELRKIVSSPIG